MAIYKQANSKYWWASIYRGSKNSRLRVSLGVEDEETALELEAQLKSAHRGRRKRDAIVSAVDELLGTDQPRSIRLDKIWETYSNLRDLNLAPETLRKMKTWINRLVRMLQEGCPTVKTMADVSREVAIDITDRLRDECKTGKTFNNIKSSWGTVWSKLLLRGGIPENVWCLIPNASTKDSLSGRAFTPEEENNLLRVCREEHEEYYGASLIARHTALRYKSVIHLKWKEIKDGVLSTVPSKTERHGIVVTVPVVPRVADWLKEWKKRRNGEYIFPMLLGRYNSTWYTSVYTDLIKRAGIEAEGAYLSFGCWRHTLETRLVAAGIPREVRNRITGRSRDSILGDTVYNHDLTSIKKALEAAG